MQALPYAVFLCFCEHSQFSCSGQSLEAFIQAGGFKVVFDIGFDNNIIINNSNNKLKY